MFPLCVPACVRMADAIEDANSPCSYVCVLVCVRAADATRNSKLFIA